MRKNNKFRVFIIVGSFFLFLQNTQANNIDLIRSQFIAYYAKLEISTNEVQKYLETLSNEGTWADIDYKSKIRGDWPTRIHLDRALLLSTAYVKPNTKYYKNKDLLEAILNSLNHWIEKKYENPNWFNAQIGIPTRMAKCFVLLGNDLPYDTLNHENALIILNKTKIGSKGQNRVWKAGVVFMRGLLRNDSSQMNIGINEIWDELKVSTKVGIQPDWSFHQHGAQQQLGNYGLSFSEDMIRWASILRGTKYALPEEKRSILRNYLINGLSWVAWNGKLDINACGRQIDNNAQIQKWERLKSQLQIIIDVDPEYSETYKKHLAVPNKTTGFKIFQRSDLVSYKQLNWFGSLKMTSTRTVGAETCNSENEQGIHQSDGVFLLYETGNEYLNITPIWDWKRLPGTTCDQGFTSLIPASEKGNSDFVGAIKTKTSVVASMVYKRENLSAKKAWFFHKNKVVCLGTGIGGESKGEVWTSIQQSLLKGVVTTSTGRKELGGNYSLASNNWIHHNNTGYRILNEANLDLKVVSGNWDKSFPKRGSRPVVKDVFSIWMNHGKSPKNQTYGYVIYPTVEAHEMEITIKRDSIKILNNTPKLQAIEGREGVHAIFYKPGTVTLSRGQTIRVDRPCILAFQNNHISVLDPTQKLNSLIIKIDKRKIQVYLPQGKNIGKQIDFDLSKNQSIVGTITN